MKDGRTIDLHGHEQGGTLELSAGGAGDIVNGGVLTGQCLIATNNMCPGGNCVFSGTAAFSSIAQDGLLRTESDGDLAGTFHIVNDVDGTIGILAGSLLESGRIWIEGDVGGIILVDGIDDGEIDIGGSLEGTGRIIFTPQRITGLGGSIGGPLSIGGNCAGDIEVENDIDGTVTVTGDVEGDIEVSDGFAGELAVGGDFKASATMEIGGEFTGMLDVDGGMDGDVRIEGNENGEMQFNGYVNGDVEIEGDAEGSIAIANGLEEKGRILVGGALAGDVSIGKGTNMNSQITFSGGMETTGSLVINASQGDYAADGDVLVGVAAAPLPSIATDGCILVKVYNSDPPQQEIYGGLNGDLNIVGCHSGNVDFNLCAVVKGAVSFDQGG